MSAPQELKVWSTEKFDLLSKTVVIYGVDPTLDKPQTKPVKTEESPNTTIKPHRNEGWMKDGTKINVGIRGAKAGEDIKAIGKDGFILALDGFQWQKMSDGKGGYTAEVKKTADGVLMATTSAAYILSNGPVYSKNAKVYPALAVEEKFVRAVVGMTGVKIAMFDTDLQSSVIAVRASNGAEFKEKIAEALHTVLDTTPAFVEGLNGLIDKRKQGMVNGAIQDANDNGEDYEGVQFKPGKLDDGSVLPVALVCVGFRNDEGRFENREFLISLEEKDTLGEKPKIVRISSDAAIETFSKSNFHDSIAARFEAGEELVVGVLPGTTMFTIKSFSERFAQVTDPANAKMTFGDVPFIRGIADGFSKAVVAIKGTFNSNYPREDNVEGEFSANRVVTAPRQSEMGMNRGANFATDKKWMPPQSVNYDLSKYVCMVAKAAPEPSSPKP